MSGHSALFPQHAHLLHPNQNGQHKCSLLYQQGRWDQISRSTAGDHIIPTLGRGPTLLSVSIGDVQHTRQLVELHQTGLLLFGSNIFSYLCTFTLEPHSCSRHTRDSLWSSLCNRQKLSEGWCSEEGKTILDLYCLSCAAGIMTVLDFMTSCFSSTRGCWIPTNFKSLACKPKGGVCIQFVFVSCYGRQFGQEPEWENVLNR